MDTHAHDAAHYSGGKQPCGKLCQGACASSMLVASIAKPTAKHFEPTLMRIVAKTDNWQMAWQRGDTHTHAH
eukprot:4209956-Alexandrium_andersonii.AAC.1